MKEDIITSRKVDEITKWSHIQLINFTWVNLTLSILKCQDPKIKGSMKEVDRSLESILFLFAFM